MEVKVTGLDGVTRSVSEAIKYVAQDIEADFQDWGNETANVAKKIHKFGRPYSKGYKRTGDGDRSIKAEAKGTQVRLYIDPDDVTVPSKKYGSFNYIWAQHDGTKRGIKADLFLVKAVKITEDKLKSAY